jgi:hypothetical protein
VCFDTSTGGSPNLSVYSLGSVTHMAAAPANTLKCCMHHCTFGILTRNYTDAIFTHVMNIHIGELNKALEDVAPIALAASDPLEYVCGINACIRLGETGAERHFCFSCKKGWTTKKMPPLVRVEDEGAAGSSKHSRNCARLLVERLRIIHPGNAAAVTNNELPFAAPSGGHPTTDSFAAAAESIMVALRQATVALGQAVQLATTVLTPVSVRNAASQITLDALPDVDGPSLYIGQLVGLPGEGSIREVLGTVGITEAQTARITKLAHEDVDPYLGTGAFDLVLHGANLMKVLHQYHVLHPDLEELGKTFIGHQHKALAAALLPFASRCPTIYGKCSLKTITDLFRLIDYRLMYGYGVASAGDKPHATKQKPNFSPLSRYTYACDGCNMRRKTERLDSSSVSRGPLSVHARHLLGRDIFATSMHMMCTKCPAAEADPSTCYSYAGSFCHLNPVFNAGSGDVWDMEHTPCLLPGLTGSDLSSASGTPCKVSIQRQVVDMPRVLFLPLLDGTIEESVREDVLLVDSTQASAPHLASMLDRCLNEVHGGRIYMLVAITGTAKGGQLTVAALERGGVRVTPHDCRTGKHLEDALSSSNSSASLWEIADLYLRARTAVFVQLRPTIDGILLTDAQYRANIAVSTKGTVLSAMKRGHSCLDDMPKKSSRVYAAYGNDDDSWRCLDGSDEGNDARASRYFCPACVTVLGAVPHVDMRAYAASCNLVAVVPIPPRLATDKTTESATVDDDAPSAGGMSPVAAGTKRQRSASPVSSGEEPPRSTRPAKRLTPRQVNGGYGTVVPDGAHPKSRGARR